ncbi:transposase, IS605 OrfB family [Desulfurobacterium thermolithotrophum DSM 11699]|uniref:Transposase, IS605 OrfB family n=1 Tax=Desulfurobacterium thermolithotrophum (strain DSM 11699 / BSA) TaxID=868864 RepID=F0S255_DESTD|nr:RNA-guided endonuclease TnpB family protein [Desulfurobacterium thermolithotrophum]ADY72998.1 transposase, IS605 OrfB family [Desulfurobacterium thermolithotrophum DSM 11699]
MLSSRVLSIRISGKDRKEKVRKLLFDLAHFKNLWIILIRRYKELYGYYSTDQSILYGLIADKEYSSKKEGKLRKFKEVRENILKDEELTGLLKALKEQKRKVDNNYLLQQVIRSVVKSFNDYRKAYKEYQKNPKKFKGTPKPPKSKKLKFLMNFSVELNVNTFERLEDSILIKLRINSKEFLKVKLPKNFNFEIKSIRLKLFGTDVYADVVYKVETLELRTTGEYTAGIDLGLNNLIALVSTNPNLESLIVSGKEIKAFNQWFNKEKAKLQSEIDTIRNKLSQIEEEEETQNLKQLLTEKLIILKELSAYRKRRIDNDFHKISRKVVDILKATDHKKLYIGKGATESKDGINIGKKNNQHFVSVPFRRLIGLIKYKAEEVGIKALEVEEAFTSKTSPFADILEVRKIGKKYLKAKEKEDKTLLQELLNQLKSLRKAIRKFRGLLKDKVSGAFFNADLVGAYNILRVGENSLRLIEDLKLLFVKLCNPVKFRLIEFFYKVSCGTRKGAGSSSHNAGLSPFDYQSCGNLTTF